VAFREIFKTTDAPGTPDPEERLRATPWEKPSRQVVKAITEKQQARDKNASLDAI
jgi:hypothetical protein